ncbi:MAG TPA: Rieske (2Fe-2S) protein [Candidatus Limnocylindria bacterium]|nr:Rieske (2Fe-2S) protein [Candidatus Limnocylindria bacterium]
MDNVEKPQCCCSDRRGFLKKLAANVLGSVITLVPLAAGLAVWLDPVRRKTKTDGQLVRVATLNALPEDGVPRKFSVLASRVDAWNRSPQTAIGAVYLRREKGAAKPRAVNVVCPHAGCFVDYMDERQCYLCPCHNSTFALDGKINDPTSPSPRGLDELEVEVRKGGEVWVKFQNYRAGVAEKIPA